MKGKTKRVVINTDGGARGNPGLAACAFVIKEDGQVVYKEGFFLGEATNNIAEYNGLIKAYEFVLKSLQGLEEIVFKIDSELVVKQLNGVYRVRDKKLFLFWRKIKEMEKEAGARVFYVYVPRTENKDADFLVNSVLNSVSRNGISVT